MDPPVVSRTQSGGWVGFKARSDGAHSRGTLQMGLQHSPPGTTPQSDPCGPSSWTGSPGPAAGLGTGSRGRGLTGDHPLPASFFAAQAPESPQSTVTWPSHLQMKIPCPAQTPWVRTAGTWNLHLTGSSRNGLRFESADRAGSERAPR